MDGLNNSTNYHHQLQERWPILLPFVTIRPASDSVSHEITELVWTSFFVDCPDSNVDVFCQSASEDSPRIDFVPESDSEDDVTARGVDESVDKCLGLLLNSASQLLHGQ